MAMPLPTPELGLFEHLVDVKEFILFVFSLLVGLVVWAWTRMEKSVDRCADAIEEHAANNEIQFDRLYNHLRGTDERLNKLLGEHEHCKKQVEIMSRELNEKD